MSRRIEIAFLPAGTLRDAFEIIKRTLSLSNPSLPHVTLRHQSKSGSRLWANAVINNQEAIFLTLDGITTFDDAPNGEALRTVIVRCNSEDLDLRSYKPDFPRSVPHITLYEGESSPLAAAALRILGAMPWHREIVTQLEVYSSSRDASEASGVHLQDGDLYTTSGFALRARLLRELGIPERRTSEMTNPERMALVVRAAEAIVSSTTPNLAFRHPPSRDTQPQPSGQLSFWSTEEITAISGVGTAEERRRNRKTSSFATPPELALDVIAGASQFLEPGPVDVGDPAAGNGILLAAARRTLGVNRIRSAQLIELDLAAARLAGERWARTGALIIQADFLDLAPSASEWSFVVANPPYRRSQLIANETAFLRDSLQKSLNIPVSARSDLYVYFLLRAHAWMRDDAVAAWIVPAEFQVTRYGATVRSYLTSHVQLLRMHTYDVTDPVFDNALTSTTVLIFRKRRPSVNGHGAVRVTEGGTVQAPKREVVLTPSALSASARWNFSALRSGQSRDRSFVTIGDIFEARRGIATGANKLFVLTDETLDRYQVARRWVTPLLPPARDVVGAKIGADETGAPVPSSGKWLIDTDEPISSIEETSPKFADYLRRVAAESSSRALVSRRRVFSKQEHRPVAPFVFAYMLKVRSQVPRFLQNSSQGTFLNNYIGLYFRPSASGPIRSDQYIADLHERLLNIDTDELTAHGRLYGKGLLKLEPSDLRRVRIPN